jgi:hypothetical protein
VTEPKHEVSPIVLLIQRQRGRACFKGFLGQLADRRMRIQIEHVHVGPAQQRMDMRTSLRSFERGGLLQEFLCELLLAYAHAPHMRKRLRHQVVCVDVNRSPSPQTHRFSHDELRPDRIDNAVGDFVLPDENIGDSAIVPVGPDVNALGGIDQLGGDPYAATRLPHAAFENVAHP